MFKWLLDKRLMIFKWFFTFALHLNMLCFTCVYFCVYILCRDFRMLFPTLHVGVETLRQIQSLLPNFFSSQPLLHVLNWFLRIAVLRLLRFWLLFGATLAPFCHQLPPTSISKSDPMTSNVLIHFRLIFANHVGSVPGANRSFETISSPSKRRM